MIVGQDYLYACIQRTGTASMRRWLMQYYDGKAIEFYHCFDVSPHVRHLFRFVTVRNPYDRAFSLWRFRSKKENSFEEMCKRYASLGLSQQDIIERLGGAKVLKLENLKSEVTRLPFFDSKKPMPRHLRKSEDMNISFSEKDREAVRKYFSKDFQFLGYTP